MNCASALRSSIAEAARQTIDIKNRRRVVRALEICLLTGRPASEVVAGGGDPGRPGSPTPATGVFVFRDREELYATNQSNEWKQCSNMV